MKKRVMVIGPLLIIIIMAGLLFYNSSYRLNRVREQLMKDASITYYENYYYPSVDREYLKKYEDKGIIITLNTLNSNKELKSLIGGNRFKNCDKDKTLAKIIPKSPYNKNNYEIEINLACE